MRFGLQPGGGPRDAWAGARRSRILDAPWAVEDAWTNERRADGRWEGSQWPTEPGAPPRMDRRIGALGGWVRPQVAPAPNRLPRMDARRRRSPAGRIRRSGMRGPGEPCLRRAAAALLLGRWGSRLAQGRAPLGCQRPEAGLWLGRARATQAAAAAVSLPAAGLHHGQVAQAHEVVDHRRHESFADAHPVRQGGLGGGTFGAGDQLQQTQQHLTPPARRAVPPGRRRCPRRMRGPRGRRR